LLHGGASDFGAPAYLSSLPSSRDGARCRWRVRLALNVATTVVPAVGKMSYRLWGADSALITTYIYTKKFNLHHTSLYPEHDFATWSVLLTAFAAKLDSHLHYFFLI